MEQTKLLRAILPDVLIDNFDVVSFDKTDSRFDIYLDEKKVQMREDKKYGNVISHGFGDYHVIQDFPSVAVLRIFMYANANGWTRTPARSSATTGNCPSLTRLD